MKNGQRLKTQSKVQAGLVSDITSTIKKLLETICKGLDKLFDSKGYSQKDEEEIEEDGLKGFRRTYESGTGELVAVEIFQTNEKPELFTVNIRANGHREVTKKRVNKNKIDDVVTDYMDQEGLGTNEGKIYDDADASKKLQVSLKKVNCSTGTEIHLTAINANYNIIEAMTDLNAVLADDEFVDTLSEEDQSFEIVEVTDADEYDVEPMDGQINTDSSYEELLRAAVECKNDLQCVAWGAKGIDMESLKRAAGEYIWSIDCAIELFANLMIQYTGRVPHLSQLCSGYSSQVDMSEGLEYSEGLQVIKNSIDNCIDVFEALYVNLEHDVQKRVDDILVDLKNYAGNKVARALM